MTKRRLPSQRPSSVQWFWTLNESAGLTAGGERTNKNMTDRDKDILTARIMTAAIVVCIAFITWMLIRPSGSTAWRNRNRPEPPAAEAQAKAVAWEMRMALRPSRGEVMQFAGRLLPKLKRIAVEHDVEYCRKAALQAAPETMRISYGYFKGYDPEYVYKTLIYVDRELHACSVD